MTAGHFVIDSNAALLFALMPLFIARFHFSFALAGLLTTSMLLVSSVSQPIFGYLQDRVRLIPLASFGLALGGIAIGFTGLAGGYATLLALVVLAGLGSAIFHPQAAAQAGRAGMNRPAWGIAVFFTGGSAGTGVMTLVIVPLVVALGLPATLIAIVPGLAVASLFLRAYRTWLPAPTHDGPVAKEQRLRAVALPLSLLLVVSILRSAVMSGFLTFIPTLVVNRGGSLNSGAIALAAFLISGALGSVLGGIAASAVGSRSVVLLSLVLGFVSLFPASGLAGALLVVWLIGTGTLLFASEAQVTSLAQGLLPRMAGLASSLMMGIGLGVGNLGAVLTGATADRLGLVVALRLTTLLLLGAIAAAAGFIVLDRRSGAAQPERYRRA